MATKGKLQGGVEIISIEKESKQIKDPFEGFEDKINPPFDIEILADFHIENTWNYRCINIKADMVCSGIRIKALDPEGNIENSSHISKLRAFIKRANHKGESLKTVLKRFWSDYEAIGNAYLEIDRNLKGELANLYHVPGYTVRKSLQKDGYWQVREAREQYFNAFGSGFERGINEILHHHSYYLKSDYYGIPDFLPALAAAILDKNINEFNSDFFDEGMLASFAIITKGFQFDSISKTNIQNFFKNNVKGLKNAHKALYLPIDDPSPETEIRFEKLMSDVNEGSFLNLRNSNRDEIVAAHGVLPRLLGIVTPGSLGGQSEGFSQLKTFKVSIDDKKEDLENILNRIINEAMGIEDLEITFGRLDTTNRKEDAEFVKVMREMDVLTEDEGRSEIGYEPKTDEQKQQRSASEILKAVKGLKEILEKHVDRL